MGEACVGIGYKSDKIEGSGPYKSVIIDACRLKGKSRINIGAYIDVTTNNLVFTNLNVASKKTWIYFC